MEGSMSRNLVVVVDALDECHDGNVVGLLLDSLFCLVGRLPIKFFITSRPEPAIYDRLASQVDDIRCVLHLHEVSKSSVQGDIKKYLEEGLEVIRPSKDEVEKLAALSGQLFIYAATVVRYIIPENAPADSHMRLKTMLDINSKSTKKYSDIDALYTAILSSVVDNKALEPNEQDNILSVVWAIVCSNQPVTLHVLGLLAGIESEVATSVALAPLRSLLHVSHVDNLISTFHASFPQFICDESRSNKFFCNSVNICQQSAARCLKTMNTQSLSIFDPNLIISPRLSYASKNWISYILASHCVADHVLDELYTELRIFFAETFEAWQLLISEPMRDTTALQESFLKRLTQWLHEVDGPPDLCKAATIAQKSVSNIRRRGPRAPRTSQEPVEPNVPELGFLHQLGDQW
ncbi:hypothetical protein FRC11_000326, partial [Ceratobasidium sp. 423]